MYLDLYDVVLLAFRGQLLHYLYEIWKPGNAVMDLVANLRDMFFAADAGSSVI
jgi:hypothetical protein